MINEKIKLLREQKGWTQIELADKLGVSKSSVSQWESGMKEPRMGMIQKIADIFGVTKSYIIEDGENFQSYDPDALEIAEELAQSGYGELNILFKKIKDASPEDKKKMIDMLKIMLPKDDEDY